MNKLTQDTVPKVHHTFRLLIFRLIHSRNGKDGIPSAMIPMNIWVELNSFSFSISNSGIRRLTLSTATPTKKRRSTSFLIFSFLSLSGNAYIYFTAWRMIATWRRSRNVVDHSVWMVLFSFFEIASRRLSRVHKWDRLIIEDAKICASVKPIPFPYNLFDSMRWVTSSFDACRHWGRLSIRSKKFFRFEMFPSLNSPMTNGCVETSPSFRRSESRESPSRKKPIQTEVSTKTITDEGYSELLESCRQA